MKKCLVADNNVFYLEFFKDLFSSYGYEVTTALDGVIALELARKEKFDLFLLDYVMPKVDGIRLSKYIRAIDHYKETPIILITAAALESVAIKESDVQIDLFVAKAPFDKLKNIFKEILPHLDTLKHKEKNVIGLENIFPRQIVKELLVTELNYSVIFQNLIEGILELDENGIAIFANNSFCKIIDKEEHEIIGHTVDKILDFDINHELKEAYSNLKKYPTVQRETIVNTIKDKTIHFSFYNIIGASNKTHGSFIILQDITNIRNKVFQISAILNITQAFLADIDYKSALQYVIYELRRLINATNVTLLFACNGLFKGERLTAFDRKIKENERKKIEFWINKIDEWKKNGLINVKNINKINHIKFDNLPILWLPVVFKDIFLGTIIGFKNNNDVFDDEEVRFFETIGSQIAVYMANEEILHKLQRDKNKFLPSTGEQSKETITHDLLSKLEFTKWEEINKKNLIKDLAATIGNNLSTIGGCVDVLKKNICEKGVINNIVDGLDTTFTSLLDLKESLAILNKVGLQEENEFHIFNLEMMIRKVLKDNDFMGNVSIPEDFSSGQFIGDFDKITFFIRVMVNDIKSKGGDDFSLQVEPNGDDYAFSINFTAKMNSNSFDILLKDSWEDIISGYYYAFWKLKALLKFLNAKVTCTFTGEKCKILFIFSKQKKGDVQ